MLNLRENNDHRPGWMLIGGFMACIIGSTAIVFGTMGAALPLVIIGSVVLGAVLGACVGGISNNIIRNGRI